MTIKAEQQKPWNFNELERIYNDTGNKVLGERLLAVMKFAKHRGSMMISKNYYPSFGLRGKHGKRIISFWSPERHHVSPPGSIHLFVNPKRYELIEERDLLVKKLNDMFSFGYDINNIYRSRTSKESLSDLTEDDFSTFMEILEEYSL